MTESHGTKNPNTTRRPPRKRTRVNQDGAHSDALKQPDSEASTPEMSDSQLEAVMATYTILPVGESLIADIMRDAHMCATNNAEDALMEETDRTAPIIDENPYLDDASGDDQSRTGTARDPSPFDLNDDPLQDVVMTRVPDDEVAHDASDIIIEHRKVRARGRSWKNQLTHDIKALTQKRSTTTKAATTNSDRVTASENETPAKLVTPSAVAPGRRGTSRLRRARQMPAAVIGSARRYAVPSWLTAAAVAGVLLGNGPVAHLAFGDIGVTATANSVSSDTATDSEFALADPFGIDSVADSFSVAMADMDTVDTDANSTSGTP